MKFKNTLDASISMSGLNYGEHGIDPNNMVKEIDRLSNGVVNCLSIRPNNVALNDETYIDIAKFAYEKKIYFGILYAYQFPPRDKISHFNKPLCDTIERIAGKYFLGEFMGEAGSDKGAKAKGYFIDDSNVIALQMPPQNFKNMQEAKDNYIKFIKKMTQYDDSIGLYKTLLVEATAFQKYNLEGGIQTPILELMPGNPEILISFTRGAAIGYKRKMWGGFIANEWYGGYRHEDELKIKRLRLAYQYLYMSGANIVLLESGVNELKSFGYSLDYNSKECQGYRKELANYYELINKDTRPSCGPYAKIAFIHGNLDGYTNFMGSSVWSQFDREEWGISSPEKSWKILDEVYKYNDWHDMSNFGESGVDLSNAPAYGNYDVIPVESDIDILEAYDTLIFVGWNTMTNEILEKLMKYVSSGGHLVIGACHFNTTSVREEIGERSKLIENSNFEKLIGGKIVGSFRTNNGVKFTRDSERAEILYSGTKNLWCDCNYCGSYSTYADVMLTTGKVKGFFADSFWAPKDLNLVQPAVLENNFGNGLVTFFTSLDYFGDNGAYPVYKTVIKEYLTSSHRNCELKVYGNDKVRFSLFSDKDGSNKKLYLLNTNYNNNANITISYKDKTQEINLKSLELKIIKI